MIRAISVVVLAGALASTTAAAQDTLWTRVYGGGANDFVQSVRQTDDGGYIFCGGTESYGAGGYDVYILRTDACGDTLWTRTYGGTGRDTAGSLDSSADGGFILVGETTSAGAGDHDVYLLRIDAYGDTLWTRTFGGTNYERGSRVIRASDGRYVICGRTASFGAGDHDVYLLFVDPGGDTLGTRTYGGSQTDIGFSVVETADGGFVLGGVTSSSGAGGYDYYLIKTDAQGTVEWERTYGGPGAEWAHDAVQTADGGYILVGSTDTWTHGSSDVYIVKADSSGDTTWTRAYGGVNLDAGNAVRHTPDGGYVVVGFSGDWEAGWGDIYMLRTDALGDTLWTRVYGRGPWYNRETSGELEVDSGGDYIVAGSSEMGGTGVEDAYILKISHEPQSGAVIDAGSGLLAGGQAVTNYPNPFADRTRVSFYISRSGHVTLGVYNVLGERIALLVSDHVTPGNCHATWDASGFSPGVYFLRLAAEGGVSERMMVLAR